jgi:hypothetical protein
MTVRALPLLLGLVVASAARAQTLPPLQPEQWKLDVVYRTRGRTPLRGLVLSQTPEEVRLKCVFRKAGSPTVVLKDVVARADVARLELLGAADRELLRTRLETLDRERKVLLAQSRLWKGDKLKLPPGEVLELKPAPWGPGGKQTGLVYESALFRLVSNARKDIVLLTAIQLEQVFAAYARCLPPRAAPKPTTILLTRSLDDYKEFVKARGQNLLNPAFFDARANEVICGCDLERLGTELARVRERHDRLKHELLRREQDLKRVYHNNVPAEVMTPVRDAYARIRRLEEKNRSVVRLSHLRLVQRLCHEAFHAYLAGCVFGGRKKAVPAWLDEGLAQIFETALVEGGELQLGQPDPGRLKQVKAALAKGELLSLKDVLQSTARQFQVAHSMEREGSDRHYLAAWALAYYLTFERRLVAGESLDAYLKELERGGGPLDAFQGMTDEGLSRAEAKWHDYLKRLRPNGRLSPKQ